MNWDPVNRTAAEIKVDPAKSRCLVPPVSLVDDWVYTGEHAVTPRVLRPYWETPPSR